MDWGQTLRHTVVGVKVECVWKSRMVFTTSNMNTCNINKHEVLLHGAECSIISYGNSTG